MADVYRLTDLVSEIDLVYNEATQPHFAMHYGMEIKNAEPRVTQHMPDHGVTMPVRAIDQDRQAFFTFHLLPDVDAGETPDKPINDLAKMKRWVDGADQLALKYHLDGHYGRRIYLKTQVDGSSKATLHPVKWGFVDDGKAFSSDQQYKGVNFARNVVTMLTLEPYGQAETPISLNNELTGIMHFMDSKDTTIGYGLTIFSSPTLSMDDTIYLIGGQSQKVVTAATLTQGVITDQITSTALANQQVGGYAWIHLQSGDPVSVALYDGNNQLVQSKDTTEYDKIYVDERGKTWVRIWVSGTPTNDNAYLLISREAGDATQVTTFNIDGVYLENFGTDTPVAPDAWISSMAGLTMRVDRDATNQDRFNWVDIWGVPGDAPAMIDFKITWSDVLSNHYQYAGKHTERDNELFNLEDQLSTIDLGIFESSSLTLTNVNNVTGSTPTGTMHGGDAKRMAATAADASGSWYRIATSPTHYGMIWRVMAVVRTTDTTATIKAHVQNNANSPDLALSSLRGPQSLQSANVWELLDLGFLDLRGLLDSNYNSSAGFVFYFDVAGLDNGATFDIDLVYMIPMTDGFYVAEIDQSSYGKELWIVGSQAKTYSGHETNIIPLGADNFFTIPPGDKITRITTVAAATGGVIDITDTGTIGPITITPRTRHLLGTL